MASVLMDPYLDVARCYTSRSHYRNPAKRPVGLSEVVPIRNKSHPPSLRKSYTSRSDLLPPIHNLPVELLRLIFKYCMSWDPWLIYVEWFNFSHVCRLWRDISLGDPTLWVRPCLEHPELAREMVARAQMLPLDVVVHNMDKERRRKAAYFLLTQVPTMKTLTLWANEDELPQMLNTAANHGCTQSLKSLRIRCELPDPCDARSRAKHRTVDPGCFPELDRLLAVSPNVSELELQCCMPHTSRRLLSQLTSLKIDNSFASFDRRPCIDVIPFLRSTPTLTQLSICRALVPPSSQIYMQGVPLTAEHARSWCAELQNLASLSLSDDLFLIMDALPRLHLPALAYLEIHNTDHHSPSSASLEDLAAYTAAWLCASDAEGIRVLDVNARASGQMVIGTQTVTIRMNVGDRCLSLDLRMKASQITRFLDEMTSQFQIQGLDFPCVCS